jgi:hypothetical protein
MMRFLPSALRPRPATFTLRRWAPLLARHRAKCNYRRRVKQADELNEFAIAESLRGILVQEQDHLIALATALGIDAPDPGIADR